MQIEKVQPKAYFDITNGSKKLGRVVFELYDDLAPKATENFLNLCKGITLNDKSYSYQDTIFDKVIKNFMIQGGSLNANVSTIYGDQGINKPIPGENLSDDLSHPFKLCMANNGDVNCNGSQFFITTSKQSHMAGKYSVFGHVIHGKSIIREIERVKTNKDDVPESNVVIDQCGVWTDDMPVPIFNASYDTIGGDIYEEYPEDDNSNFNQESTEEAFSVASKIKESGTLVFKKGDKENARFKYIKALRYIMEFIPDPDQDPEWYKKFIDLKKKTYLNLSLCCLQLKDYHRCIDYCSYLLDMDDSVLTKQDKTKTLFRKGSANVGLKKYKLGLDDLKSANILTPDDVSIQKSIESTEKLLQQQKQNEKATYSKFFG